MSTIIVNATAARSSGAFAILNQFVDSLSVIDFRNKYYIFVASNVKLKLIDNVCYIPIDTVSWFKRIYWDEVGLRRWLKVHKVSPDLYISFQNTGAKIEGDVPQIIYYHQPLPLANYKWNILKKEQLVLFLYKNIYGYFVSRYLNSNTHVVVQIPSIKEAFAVKYKFPRNNISVIRPTFKNNDYVKIGDCLLDNQFIHFLYPATPFIYKNHIDIIHAIYLLKKEGKIPNIKIHFTFEEQESPSLYSTIQKLGLKDYFIFEGSLSYETLLSLYKSSDALLFPSYIETFGLPLIEAASAGLQIIAIDLPYSRDVIGEYEGVVFVPLHDIDAFANAILNVCKSKRKFPPLLHEIENNWNRFFQLIDKLKL